MKLEGILHRCGATDCYARNENELVINIRTNKEITSVVLMQEDPYVNGISGRIPWTGTPMAMQVSLELREYFVWTAVVSPKFKRLQYYFEVISGAEKRILMEDGIYTEQEMQLDGMMKQYFKYAWMNPSDLYRAPQWVEDTFWYQIMPDRFCRMAQASDSRKPTDWTNTADMKYNQFYGGNFSGIASKLPYLQELGINGIYLTPIFESPSDHKYNTTDYLKVSKDFGTDEDFRELVEKAHALGIKIMIDAVFNHCGRDFFAWRDVVKRGKASRYYDWFFIQKENFGGEEKTRDGRYYSFAFEAQMPKLNTNHPEVAEYFCGICREWIAKWNVDGIRFDVGNEIAHSFIRKLRTELKAVKPDLFLLGEIWHDAGPWLAGDEYDSVMDYPFMETIHNFFTNKRWSARNFMYQINRCYSLYTSMVNRVLFHFLDSHDVGRVFSRCENEDVFFQQLALLVTMTGTPCIFYGTEIALDGKCGPYNRKPMPWENIQNGEYEHIYREVRALIRLRRNNNDTLKKCDIRWKVTEKRFLCYERPGDNTITVYLNAEKEPQKLRLCGEEILYARRYSGNVLAPDGTLIVRRKAE